MDVQKLIEEVKAMSVLELNERVKALEAEFGVSAAAPVAAAGAAGAAEEMCIRDSHDSDAGRSFHHVESRRNVSRHDFADGRLRVDRIEGRRNGCGGHRHGGRSSLYRYMDGRGRGAVSYTHLDVYKRQDRGLEKRIGGKRRGGKQVAFQTVNL